MDGDYGRSGGLVGDLSVEGRVLAQGCEGQDSGARVWDECHLVRLDGMLFCRFDEGMMMGVPPEGCARGK